jgi:hypothetical protein
MGKADLTIRIPAGSSEAHITLTNEKGVANHKTVVMDNLISSLTSSFVFSTGLLPNNTRFFSGTMADYIIGIESPSRVRRFLQSSYSTAGKLPNELKIPFPTCMFVFKVKGFKIVDSKVFAMKGSAYKEGDTMFRLPFGNTYRDGRICWGSSNKLPAIANPMALVSVIAMFYDAPFNGDLYDDNTIARPHDNKNVRDFWSMLVYLNGKETFPTEMLYSIGIQLSKLMRDPNA